MGIKRREKRGNLKIVTNNVTGEDETYRRAKNSGLWIRTDHSGLRDYPNAPQLSDAHLDGEIYA